MRVIKRLLRNPCSCKGIFAHVANDILALLGYYKYDYPVIFIAGLPKSGTTWVQTQLARVPGYNVRRIHDPQGTALNHDVADSIFAALPKSRYTVLKLHTRYSPANFEVIQRHVPKFMVLIRDLRDMCISRYFDVKARRGHRHHELYNSETLEVGLTHCIDVIGDEYVDWVRDWVRVAGENPGRILLITYEELNLLPAATFWTIFKFFHLPIDEHFVGSLARSKLRGEQSLTESLRKGSTARKGVVGDWKSYFSAAHEERFKEVAGNLLIELGYEI